MTRLLLIPLLGLLWFSLLLIVSGVPHPSRPVRRVLSPLPRSVNGSLPSASTTDSAGDTRASANITDNVGNTGNAGNTGVSANTTDNADGTRVGTPPDVHVHYADDTCVGEKVKIILEEMQYAVEMAEQAASDPRSGIYFNSFFAASVQNDLNPADVF